MTINHLLFRHAMAQHVDGIKRLCQQWGIPQLATHVTVILRDPTNDTMSFVLTDEASVADAYRVARRLEEEER